VAASVIDMLYVGFPALFWLGIFSYLLSFTEFGNTAIKQILINQSILILIGLYLAGVNASLSDVTLERMNSDLTSVQSFLNEAQQSALSQAMGSPEDFLIYGLRIKVGKNYRNIIFLGESHMKDSKAETLGRNVVLAFSKIAYEGASIAFTDSPLGEIVGSIFQMPNEILTSLMPGVAGSTIDEAIGLSEVEMEGNEITTYGFLTLRHPNKDEVKKMRLVYWLEDVSRISSEDLLKARAERNFILNARNRVMGLNITRYFSEFPDEETLLVVCGEAHVPGLVRLMQDAANVP